MISKNQNVRIALIGNPDTAWIRKIYGFFRNQGFTVHVFSITNSKEEEICKDRFWTDCSVILSSRCPVFHTMITLFRLWKEVRRFKPDVIWGHYVTDLGFYAMLLPIKAHKFLSTWGSDINLKGGIRSEIKRFAALNIAKRILVSWTDPDFLNRVRRYCFNKRKVAKVHWGGISLDTFYPLSEGLKKKIRDKYSIPSNAFVILSLRHVKRAYNIDVIVKAYLSLKSKIENLFLILICGFYEENLVAEIKKEVRGDRHVLLFEEFLEPEELNELYNIADVGISILNQDMLGAPILELMATGGIPLLTPLPSYRNFFADKPADVFYVHDLTPEALKETILHVYWQIKEGKVSIPSSSNISIARGIDFEVQMRKVASMIKRMVRKQEDTSHEKRSL